jgi:hypothetical protein
MKTSYPIANDGSQQTGSLFFIDIKYVPTEVRDRWRQQLQNNQKNASFVSCTVLGLIKGTRLYECEFEGVPLKFKLSSKALATVRTSGLRRTVNIAKQTCSDEESSVIEDEADIPDGNDGSGEVADDWHGEFWSTDTGAARSMATLRLPTLVRTRNKRFFIQACFMYLVVICIAS